VHKHSLYGLFHNLSLSSEQEVSAKYNMTLSDELTIQAKRFLCIFCVHFLWSLPLDTYSDLVHSMFPAQSFIHVSTRFIDICIYIVCVCVCVVCGELSPKMLAGDQVIGTVTFPLFHLMKGLQQSGRDSQPPL
jgi:hypothetical protein